MTPAEAAARLDKSEYNNIGTPELFAQMKEAGLVAVFGYSDDVASFEGAIHDEFDDEKIHLDRDGVITNECDEEECPYHARLLKNAKFIEVFHGDHGYEHSYETTIPHVTFEVFDDGDNYCRGIVFRLADV